MDGIKLMTCNFVIGMLICHKIKNVTLHLLKDTQVYVKQSKIKYKINIVRIINGL